MSRVYRIEVSESLRRHLGVDDGLAFHLELLDILPKDEMAELLVERLVERGFLRDEDGTLTRSTADGVLTRVDPQTGRVLGVGIVGANAGELIADVREDGIGDEQQAPFHGVVDAALGGGGVGHVERGAQ